MFFCKRIPWQKKKRLSLFFIIFTEQNATLGLYKANMSQIRPKSVRDRCVIECFASVFFCVVTVLFEFFCGCMGFYHRAESDLFLFLLHMFNKSYVEYMKWVSFVYCVLTGYTVVACKQERLTPMITWSLFWLFCVFGVSQRWSSVCIRRIMCIFSVFEIDWNCKCVGLLHHPFCFQLILAFWGINFELITLLCLAKDHWWGCSTRNAHMVHIVH